MVKDFHKYFKIRPIGHEENSTIFENPDDDIVVQEKIDGANFRFMVLDGKIYWGSRTRELGGGLEDGKNWKRCKEFVKRHVKAYHNLKLLEGFIFYGEDCVKHSMSYDWDKIPAYLGFDVMCIASGKYLDCESAKMWFDALKLPFVPIIKVAKASEVAKYTEDNIPKSRYADDKAEGIVLKNYRTQMFAKIVTKKFKELNAETFGGHPKYTEDMNGKFVASFVTNARIEKIIWKIADETGKEPSMEIMKRLPSQVWFDVWEEEWRKIIKKGWELDFSKIRKQISKRCVLVLRIQIKQSESLRRID